MTFVSRSIKLRASILKLNGPQRIIECATIGTKPQNVSRANIICHKEGVQIFKWNRLSPLADNSSMQQPRISQTYNVITMQTPQHDRRPRWLILISHPSVPYIQQNSSHPGACHHAASAIFSRLISSTAFV
jgi:hypothetical protein